MNSINQAHALSPNEIDQKWIRRIEEWRVSGKTIAEWVREHEDFSYEQFIQARRRLFPEDIRKSEFMEKETTWTSLTLEIPSSDLDVYINECHIVVKAGFDQELLREVVEVLKNAH